MKPTTTQTRATALSKYVAGCYLFSIVAFALNIVGTHPEKKHVVIMTMHENGKEYTLKKLANTHFATANKEHALSQIRKLITNVRSMASQKIMITTLEKGREREHYFPITDKGYINATFRIESQPTGKTVSVSLLGSLYHGIVKTSQQVTTLVQTVAEILLGKLSFRNIGGPIDLFGAIARSLSGNAAAILESVSGAATSFGTLFLVLLLPLLFGILFTQIAPTMLRVYFVLQWTFILFFGTWSFFDLLRILGY